MEKMAAHQDGVLHRAVSVLVFNNRNELMLQQRALTKYHSPGLWTNTCCSHPRPGEPTPMAAHRRLKEEMGFECQLNKSFDFIYRAEFENGLTEHEFDHVFFGTFDDEPQPNPEEVDSIAWMPVDVLLADMKKNKSNYTYWFIVAINKIYDTLIEIT